MVRMYEYGVKFSHRFKFLAIFLISKVFNYLLISSATMALLNVAFLGWAYQCLCLNISLSVQVNITRIFFYTGT